MLNFKKIFLLSMSLLTLIFCMIFKTNVYAQNEDVLNGGEGTYSTPISLDLKMGSDNFTNPVTIEKENSKYYMTFGFSSQIGYLNLNLNDMEVGKTSEKKDGWTYYTYTLSENNLKSKLSFTAFISAMSREVTFNVTLKLSSSSKISNDIRDLGERPAEFVPKIETNAALEYSLNVGTIFPLPEASSKLGNKDCNITITALYDGEEIEINNGKITLENVGDYSIMYKATDSEYKTSYGNDSYTEYVVTIHSITGENGIVKFNDKNNVLQEKSGLVAGRITEGSLNYEKASLAMKKIADNFEVFTAEFLNADGDSITLSDDIELMFRANDYYDRTKIRVYYMDDSGNITMLSSEGYGRYVITETNKTGIFIVCIPGVAFHMPMWGYALIFVSSIIFLIFIIIIIVLIIKHKKKLKNS